MKDKLLEKLLTSKSTWVADRKNAFSGKISVFDGVTERKAFEDGNLDMRTVSGLEVSPGVEVLREIPQGFRGPNYIVNFTVNINNLLKEVDMTAAEFKLWYYVQENLWYFNYIPIVQAKISEELNISHQTVNIAARKFRNSLIWEKLHRDEIPVFLQNRGVWYRVNPNLIWLGKVSAMESAPSNYTIIRRKNEVKKKTLMQSFQEMIKTGRFEDN